MSDIDNNHGKYENSMNLDPSDSEMSDSDQSNSNSNSNTNYSKHHSKHSNSTHSTHSNHSQHGAQSNNTKPNEFWWQQMSNNNPNSSNYQDSSIISSSTAGVGHNTSMDVPNNTSNTNSIYGHNSRMGQSPSPTFNDDEINRLLSELRVQQ